MESGAFRMERSECSRRNRVGLGMQRRPQIQRIQVGQSQRTGEIVRGAIVSMEKAQAVAADYLAVTADGQNWLYSVRAALKRARSTAHSICSTGRSSRFRWPQRDLSLGAKLLFGELAAIKGKTGSSGDGRVSSAAASTDVRVSGSHRRPLRADGGFAAKGHDGCSTGAAGCGGDKGRANRAAAIRSV